MPIKSEFDAFSPLEKVMKDYPNVSGSLPVVTKLKKSEMVFR